MPSPGVSATLGVPFGITPGIGMGWPSVLKSTFDPISDQMFDHFGTRYFFKSTPIYGGGTFFGAFSIRPHFQRYYFQFDPIFKGTIFNSTPFLGVVLFSVLFRFDPISKGTIINSTPFSKVLFFNFDPIFRTPKRSKRPPYDPPRGKIMEDWRPKKYLIVPPRRKQMRRGRMSEWSAINKQMFQSVFVFSFRNISILLSSYIPFGTTRVKQLGTERIVCMNA